MPVKPGMDANVKGENEKREEKERRTKQMGSISTDEQTEL